MKEVIMKTIEERADAYVGHPKEIDEFTSATIKRDAYIRGAKEQKAIDDAELLRLKSSWEREAQINHNDENNYKQGFHDAVEKACEWFADYLMEIGCPDDWMRDSPNIESGEERFRKAMSDYHITQYKAINVPFQFDMQDRVPTSAFDYEALPEEGKKRRSSRRYCLQGKYYRSKKKLYDALHEIECNI